MPRTGLRLRIESTLGLLGRKILALGPGALHFLSRVGGVWMLFLSSLYFSFIGPWLGKNKLRKQLFPTMSNVGARSFPIVSMVAFLTGSVLVLQTGNALAKFGQINEVPGLVALAMTRELGPLMTAIVLIARVGASYTAVLGSMQINEEVTALRTMAIHPIGYLVAPRFLSMLVMVPCLVVLSFLVGMAGGALIAWTVYDIPYQSFVERTVFYLSMSDLYGGILKGMVFGILISVISCYYGLTARGGPTGLGRAIMVSVVTCLVVVVLSDAVLTGLLMRIV